jgi:drug/metabolite transporter (DMT)-like permease
MKSSLSLITLLCAPVAVYTAISAEVPPALMNIPGDGMRLTGESVQPQPTPEFLRMQQQLSTKLAQLPADKKKAFFATYNATELLPYSLLFALTYSIAQVFSLLAVKEGPLSLTSLFAQYSLLIPTFHGLIFLSEPYGATLFLGIGLLIISMAFANIEKKDSKKITPKWIIFVFLSFLGNGLCSVVQKIAGLELSEEYRISFMLIALLITSLSLLVIALAISKKEVVTHLKKGCLPYTLSGIANGITNVSTLALASSMDASLSFPIIASGGIVLTALVSIFIYREKLSLFQKLSFVLGILAIIAINT